MYSQTCIKRSPVGQRKSGLIRQAISYKRFNSYGKKRSLSNTGDCLLKVTTWTGFTAQSFS
jgi:hypothetical protein